VRIVLDTSVVMPAVLWRGKPYQLLEAIRQRGDIRLFTRRRASCRAQRCR
jgi:predicted nucleic acid-binding protein